MSINYKAIKDIARNKYPNDIISQGYFRVMLESNIRAEMLKKTVGIVPNTYKNDDSLLPRTSKLMYTTSNPEITYELARF